MTMNEKDRDRITINQQVAEYLASGKTIETVDHTQNHSYRQPAKRKRRDQIEYRKRTPL